MDKHTLFFSYKCSFCNTVLQILAQKGITSEFLLVNIDNEKIRQHLPQFVDRVPLICTRHKTILIEDDVSRFIQMLPAKQAQTPQINMPQIQPRSQSQSQPEQKQTDDISPFKSNLSYEFAMIGDEGNELSCNEANNFVFLKDMPDQTIATPIMAENNSKKTDSALLDNFINQRNLDINNFKASGTPHLSGVL